MAYSRLIHPYVDIYIYIYGLQQTDTSICRYIYIYMAYSRLIHPALYVDGHFGDAKIKKLALKIAVMVHPSLSAK